jgi:TolB-like protein
MSPRPAARKWFALALLALALVAGAVLGLRRWAAARHARTRVAVAVFANRTGDPALEPFGSMAADWVTRGLARTPSVEVVDVGALYVGGRGVSGQPTDPLELARRNGAGSAVAGSYYVADDSLIVRSTVVDVRTGEVLETVSPIRVPKGQAVRALELLQQHVMTAVAGALEVEFRPFTAQPTAPPPYAAYQAFVAGQAAYWQGRPAAEARDFFQYAVSTDSSFLTAAVWLAYAPSAAPPTSTGSRITAARSGRRQLGGGYTFEPRRMSESGMP